jgi:hypothetical protein
MAKDISSGAVEIVEEAIINNTIGDINEANIMEEREEGEVVHDSDDEKTDMPAPKKAATREIAEMEIDRNLKAKGGILAAKKKNKKKTNKKGGDDDDWSERVKEVKKIENLVKNEQERQENLAEVPEETPVEGIQGEDKKKKKKKKTNLGAYNLGGEV